MMALVGFIIGSVGLDLINLSPRLTLGLQELEDGVGMIPVAIGLFGIAEILENIDEAAGNKDIFQTKISGLWPSWKDWADSKWAIIRGTIIGFFCGVLPGGGGVLSSFASYGIEKKVSKHPEQFGTGVIEGVAGPESANNASVGGALIPLLSLGIPTNATLALLYAALVIHGVQPGPFFITSNTDVFWGFVASMYLGNVLLLVLNLPLIGLWVQILKVPYRILLPLIALFCIIGVYGVSSSTFDLLVMVVFGALGYLMRKFGYEAAPLILACVLGPMAENAFRQSLLLSRGDMMIFATRPISAIALGIAFLLLISTVLPAVKKGVLKYREFKE